MTREFRMPSLGADMEAGTLVDWLKKPGDLIKRGEPIAVVDTQKGAIDIECYEEGKLLRRLVNIGTRVPVGTPLAELEEIGDTGIAVPDSGQPTATPETRVPQPIASPPQAPHGTRPNVSPAARRLAAEKSVDLSSMICS
jgi:pyruvate dehydrogenase E2 component (dihydrolipoamide acetyltransferase)